MTILPISGLSKDQLSRIMQETSCSKSEARAMAKMARRHRMDIDYLVDQRLYMMGRDELEEYLRKASPRKYVEALSGLKGANDFEIYTQMLRAKTEFGITYQKFAKKKLLNASDERLARVANASEAKNERLIAKIADAMGTSSDEAASLCEHIHDRFGYSPRDIYVSRLYTLDDEGIEEFKNTSHDQKQVIKDEVMEKTGWSRAQVNAHMSRCSIEFGIDPAVYLACRCYELDDPGLSLSGNMADSKKISAEYNRGFSEILSDKQLFNETYREYIGRRFWVNRDTDFDAFMDFIDGLDVVFCKPIDSSIGRGTYKYSLEGIDPKEAYEHFMAEPKYLLEECVEQHEEMAKFYPDSLNTVRLFTILDNGRFDAFASFVRFGVRGVIDNYSSGGIACAVDPKTGIILTHASGKDGEVHETHPISGQPFKGFQIPHWDKVLELSEAALRKVDGINYVGWDIAIRQDGIVFIEGNSTPDLGVQQALCTTEDWFIRPIYYKYLGNDVYDDMLEKMVDCMRLASCSETQARLRLTAAANCKIPYGEFAEKELGRLTTKQIRRYNNIASIREAVDKVASENGVSAACAFLRMRHAEKEYGIKFPVFAREGLFDADDQILEQHAQD